MHGNITVDQKVGKINASCGLIWKIFSNFFASARKPLFCASLCMRTAINELKQGIQKVQWNLSSLLEITARDLV